MTTQIALLRSALEAVGLRDFGTCSTTTLSSAN
jgi:hypothetical protein